MTSVSVTTTANTVTVVDDSVVITVVDDAETVVVTTGAITQTTYDALVARVAALEALDILLLEG